MREMPGDEDVARVPPHLFGDPLRRVVGLKMTCGGEFRQRVARAPKTFRGLLRPEFPAVPDDRWFNPLCRTIGRELLDGGAPLRRQRPPRIDRRPDRFTMMNEVEKHRSLK